MIDIKKTCRTPKDKFEAIDMLIESQQNLIDAFHIFESILENPSEDFKDIHEKRIKDFIVKFVKK